MLLSLLACFSSWSALDGDLDGKTFLEAIRRYNLDA